jgi:ATP-dependent DNA helicase RecG
MSFALRESINRLRSHGTDDSSVEAKRATGGLPESLPSTISAFANRPGGGLILLGLDEADGFQPVAVDAVLLSHQTADLCRQSLEPPPHVEIQIHEFEGQSIVSIEVSELERGSKPCRVRSGRFQGVWIRSFDGDYRASELEEQALYATRIAPTHDQAIAERARSDDLDADSIARFLAARRAAAPSNSRVTKMTDDELLHASSVLHDGQPTVGGLLALGRHPQRIFPGYHIRAVLRTSNATEVRAADAPRIEGPIPEMIDAVVNWVSRSSPVAIRDLGNGRVVNEPLWPLDAVREIVGNALLHRDLSWSINEPVMLWLSPTELVIRNPGGLYGIRVDELGLRGVTPARNASLMSIATYTAMPDNSRTVEQLATGIPTIRRAFDDRRYPVPKFVDDAIRFTVICRSRPAEPTTLTKAAKGVLSALSDESHSVETLAAHLGRSEQTVRRDLRRLAEAGLVTVEGGRGRRTGYRLRAQ